MKRDIQRGQCHFDVSLKPFTTWHIGGTAEKLYWPKDLADLQQFLSCTPADEPLIWLGLGSNVLIDDAGIAGTVIITQGALQSLEMQEQKVYAQAGISCAQVARFAAKNGQGQGAEFMAGIPGTVGGALYMNAGAFGGETWDNVVAVQVLSREGTLHYRSKQDFEYGYRYCRGLGPHEWFVAGVFEFAPGVAQESLDKLKGLLAQRADTQPTGKPCCGSVFRNPPGDYAGRLIESLNLKGYQIGGAQVSEKHANFIINTGDATAQDVLQLVSYLQQRVKETYGIELQTEMKYLRSPQ